MAGRLRDEIKQGKPFSSLEEEAALNVLRTSCRVLEGVSEVLGPAGLTPNQYNVLRILRGAGAAGCSSAEIGGRMVTRDPDLTRLLDALAGRGWLTRERDTRDRRVVLSRITPSGKALLKRLDRPMAAIHVRQLSHVGKAHLKVLVSLLELARGGPGPEPRTKGA